MADYLSTRLRESKTLATLPSGNVVCKIYSPFKT